MYETSSAVVKGGSDKSLRYSCTSVTRHKCINDMTLGHYPGKPLLKLGVHVCCLRNITLGGGGAAQIGDMYHAYKSRLQCIYTRPIF